MANIDVAMNQESVIADIESRARSAGITISKLCGKVGLHPTTFSRWKKSERNPEPLGARLNDIGKLYAALEELTSSQKANEAASDSHRLSAGAK